MKNRLLIYGCNGYTGELISRLAVSKKLNPILAGRNEAAVSSLATELGCEWFVCDLSETQRLETLLANVHTVLHSAGPFQFTSEPMLAACIKTQTHYLDITGEISVFETAKTKSEAAKAANILVMPGVGFDVVPTDCLSALLKEKMPDASQLSLGIMTVGGRLSHGTSITIIESMTGKSAKRENGKIVATHTGGNTRLIDFGFTKKLAVEIPWGDVSTAYFTTGIPNIQVFNVLPKALIKKMKWVRYFGFLLRMRWVKDSAIKNIKAKPAGPSAQERANAITHLWGEVKNAAGETKTVRIDMPEGYHMTAQFAVEIATRLLAGTVSQRGFQTPAAVFGGNFVLGFQGVKLM